MEAIKGPSGSVCSGGVNPAPMDENLTVRVAAEQLLIVPINDLVPYANNAKVHSKAQIAQLRASLREFGFVSPVLIDGENNIIAGHGRVEAARAEGMTEIPCVLVSNLSDAQRRAYILADNRLAEIAEWNEPVLKMELENLSDLQFDTAVIGFDLAAPEPLAFGTPKKDGARAEEISREIGQEETEEYQSFVDKFKPKKTTDDCFTPDNVYQAVKDWAVGRYGLAGAEIIRPFYPGGDYQKERYPEGCVVIDNPPFSILSDICRWYMERSIQFFLFAPTLTLFSAAYGACNYTICGVSITYENGARVNTSFVSNLGEYKFEVSPELYDLVYLADMENRSNPEDEMPNYAYPAEVACAGTLWSLAKRGQALCVQPEDAAFVRALDAQRDENKAIFGGGFLLSPRAAAAHAVAACAAADRAAAEKSAAVRWALSEREQKIVESLGKGCEHNAGAETTYRCD